MIYVALVVPSSSHCCVVCRCVRCCVMLGLLQCALSEHAMLQWTVLPCFKTRSTPCSLAFFLSLFNWRPLSLCSWSEERLGRLYPCSFPPLLLCSGRSLALVKFLLFVKLWFSFVGDGGNIPARPLGVLARNVPSNFDNAFDSRFFGQVKKNTVDDRWKSIF